MVSLALGVLVLLVAFIAPVFISGANENSQAVIQQAVGESSTPTDRLEVTTTNIDSGVPNATVEVTNLQTFNTSTQSINETESAEYVVDGENVTVTLESVTTDDSDDVARLSVNHSPYFGWNGGAQTVFENMGLLIVLVSFIVLAGLLYVVINS